MIVQDEDPGFGAGGTEILIPLAGQDAHGGNGPRCPLLAECTILTERDLAVRVHALDRVLLFAEAIQPNLPVWVVIGEGLEKGRWTVVVEIDRAHNVCNRVRGTANEGRRAVAWGKRAVHTQLGPCGWGGSGRRAPHSSCLDRGWRLKEKRYAPSLQLR